MQVCTLHQTDNHASTPPLCFLQAGCPSCRPTNSVKALKALAPPPDQKQTKMREQKTNGSEVTAVDVGVQKRLQVGDIAECCTHSNQLSAGCQANTPTSFKLLHSAQISLHFIYSLKYIRFKIQTQCTQCNLQQSGRLQQGTQCTNNCPV